MLHVEVLLPAEAWSQVKVGLAGEVQPAIGGGTHRARVAVVDRILDAGSGTFGVRLELPNPGHAIPAGTRCGCAWKGWMCQPGAAPRPRLRDPDTVHG